jgi:hypothetical protein
VPSPAFALAAVAALTLGIAVTTAIFSVVNVRQQTQVTGLARPSANCCSITPAVRSRNSSGAAGMIALRYE